MTSPRHHPSGTAAVSASADPSTPKSRPRAHRAGRPSVPRACPSVVRTPPDPRKKEVHARTHIRAAEQTDHRHPAIEAALAAPDQPGQPEDEKRHPARDHADQPGKKHIPAGAGFIGAISAQININPAGASRKSVCTVRNDQIVSMEFTGFRLPSQPYHTSVSPEQQNARIPPGAVSLGTVRRQPFASEQGSLRRNGATVGLKTPAPEEDRTSSERKVRNTIGQPSTRECGTRIAVRAQIPSDLRSKSLRSSQARPHGRKIRYIRPIKTRIRTITRTNPSPPLG